MPTSTQRLALAIVSIVLWIVLFLIIAGIMGSYHPNSFTITPGGVYDSGPNLLEPFLIAGFAVFTVMVIIINMLFNRKR